jgi:signal transduction histidine kinase
MPLIEVRGDRAGVDVLRWTAGARGLGGPLTGSVIPQRVLGVRRIPSFLWASFDRLPPPIVDGVIAVAVAAYTITALAFFGGANPDDRSLGWSSYLLSVAIAAPLVVRRRWPLEATLIIAVLATIYQLTESPADIEIPQAVPLLLGLYAVGAYENRRRGLFIAFIAVEVLIGISAAAGPATGDETANTAWVIAALAIGAVVRGRRERARLAEQRRLEDARRMVDQERLRIARELHDVVAHSIATISVQAGMAAHVFDTEPEQARAALREIRQVSKDALHELRATLGVLRSAGDRADERAPSPQLDQLGDLIARAEAAGVRVAVTTSGTPRDLPGAIDVTAYRIVQEALTNVVRHAGPETHATVSITYLLEAVELRVTDNGPPPGTLGPSASAGSQLGLIGMRERVASVGGELWTGPRQEGGFEVRARLPTGDPA